VAINVDPTILLPDEVLAVGDEDLEEESRAAMHERLGRSDSIVFVSHAVRQLAEFCDRAALVAPGPGPGRRRGREVVEEYRAFVQRRRKEMRAQGLA
jgi:ABC-type polysaccharide/polyol phosphate transport system ATPase subunit